MKHPEHEFQKQVVKYLLSNKIYVFAVPNGIHIRSVATRKHYKDMGLTSGVSDLIIINPGGTYTCVELKTKTGKQTDSQKEFMQKIISLDGEYLIWRTLTDAENWVKLNKKII